MVLQSQEERTLVFHRDGARARSTPDDTDLVAVLGEGLCTDDRPIVFHVHPFGYGVDRRFAFAHDVGAVDGGFRGNDGHLHRGRLVTDVAAIVDEQADGTEGALFPQQADFRGALSFDVHGVTIGIGHGPQVVGSSTTGSGPIAGTVPFAQGGYAFDVGTGLVEDLDVHEMGVLAATDGVPGVIQQGRGDREADGVGTGVGECVDGVHRIRKGAVPEIPGVVGSGGGEAGELNTGFQADGRRGAEVRGGCLTDVDAFLKDLRAIGAAHRDGDAALTGGTPFHFDGGRVLECPQERAALDAPVVGVEVGIWSLHRGDGAAAHRRADGVQAEDGAVPIRILHRTWLQCDVRTVGFWGFT